VARGFMGVIGYDRAARGMAARACSDAERRRLSGMDASKSALQTRLGK